LKVWFVLRSYGVSGLRQFIRKHVKLGEYFHELLLQKPELFSVTTKPAFGLVTFQVKPKMGMSGKAANQADPTHEALQNDFHADAEAQYREMVNQRTKEVYEKVNAKGDFFLTSTIVGGQYVIRVVSATLKSEEKWMKQLFDELVEITEGKGDDTAA
jgi:aromatic-L-amino-acid decarboxylase